MFNKKLYFAFIALLVISNVVCGKKTKKNKRPKDQEDFTTIQPNVVAYSTFGFNDVGSYDGFVPTSPDYASFLSGVNPESTTRLYGPAFPSSMDSTGFSGNFGSQTFDGPSFGVNDDNMAQPGMLQYTSGSMNFFNNPTFGATAEQNKNTDAEDTNGQNAEDSDAPVYGTKINSRHKYRALNPFNNTEFNMYNNGYTNLSDEKYSKFPDVESTPENKPYSESSGNYQNTNSYVQNYEPPENEDFGQPAPSSVNSGLKFPKVVDFTKLKPYYPTELDTSKFLLENNQPMNFQSSIANTQMDSTFSNTFNYNNDNNKFIDSPHKSVNHVNIKNNEESADKSVIKGNSYFDQDVTYNHLNSRHKNNAHSTKTPEQKKKIKPKPWSSGNYSNNYKNWKDYSSVKGYGYSTNFSNMNFKYDVSEPKKPFNPDEIVPASSNLVDLTNYQYPETDYSNFKKMPEFHEDDEYNSVSFKDKLKANEYLNQFKNSFSTVPTTTSYWGFKSSDYSSFRDHPKKTHYSEINSDTVVNIPKRPHKLSYTKPTENKIADWPHVHHSRPQKLNKPGNDWTKDLFDTRYKSEEDLLGLRTHDTSHPTYLPSYKPTNNVFDNDNEFKNLVEKWRMSYLKTKYKDIPRDVRDYESYGSETRPMHVPIPKPYPIEVPHPVIVPVPRPFPVRVPVSRPVAVPVVREITVPIVKPVPYPVYKKVPYPVEKLVPVPVEKEVAVPVEKPYPVHIPYVRPVFHHTKPVHEDPENIEEDDYMRRPEIKKPSQYKKRPYGTRNRSRRPSRASYQDRNRRRWPDRRRPSAHNTEHRYHSRPTEFHSPPYKHRDYEEEEERSDYAVYCRKTGNC